MIFCAKSRKRVAQMKKSFAHNDWANGQNAGFKILTMRLSGQISRFRVYDICGGGKTKRSPAAVAKTKGARAMEMTRKKTRKSKVEAYFAACDKAEERPNAKTGTVAERPTPYTLAGLSEHLGIPQSEILKQAKTGSGGDAKVYADALRRIGRYIEERALLGELQYSVAAKLLDELDIGEKLPPDESEKQIVIVMEDKEGWSE